MCFYLHRDECLDGTTLNLDSGSGDFDNLSIQHFIVFGTTRNGVKMNLENHIATRVLDHAVTDVLVNFTVDNKDDVAVLGVAGAFKLLLNSVTNVSKLGTYFSLIFLLRLRPSSIGSRRINWVIVT